MKSWKQSWNTYLRLKSSYLIIFYQKAIYHKSHYIPHHLVHTRDILERVPGTLVDVLLEGFGRCIPKTSKKSAFFLRFSRYIYQDHLKNHFYCIFINYLSKMSKKVLKSQYP